MEEVSLAPLCCAGCGACVPLGADLVARCRYCNATTPIPASHSALQRAARAFAQDRVLAAQLYGRLGKPPGFIARAVSRGLAGSARVGRGGLFVVFLTLTTTPTFGVPLLVLLCWGFGFPAAPLVRAIRSAAGDPATGPLSAYLVLPIASVVVVALFGVPAVWLRRQRELVKVRADIHASLSAAPAAHPGGPNRCRTCGAALDVPKGALGVPCLYCKSDNLVALPDAWILAIRRREFQHFRSIDTALAAYRDANYAATERSWAMVVGVVLVLPLVLIVAHVLATMGLHY